MKNTILLVGLLFLIQHAAGQERITDFMYKDQGIDALTRTLSELNESLIFNAYCEEYGDEMWKYTEQGGLNLLKDILPGPSPSFPDYQGTGFTKFHNEIYFVANDSVHGYGLWKTNGNETILAHDFFEGKESSYPDYLTVYNDYLYFVVEKENHYHLCRSDGNNLEEIKDFGENEYGVAYRPNKLTASSDKLYFVVGDNSLWVSEGTEGETKKLKDLYRLYYLTCIGEKLYFTGMEGYDGEKELWTSDGTAIGTKMVKNIGGDISSWPFNFINFNGELYFTAKTNELGRELWKSDGTGEGTVLVKDIYDGTESSFSSYDFCVLNNELLFCANNGKNGNELWKTDGTESGTTMIKDINKGKGSSDPINLTKIQDYVYFQANDSIHGSELWKTNGTESGTVLISDILAGNSSSSPNNITLVGNELIFIAESKDFGQQIWKIPYIVSSQLEDLLSDQIISIYPNPSSDYIYFSPNLIDSDISIYNERGQLISIRKVRNNSINISNLCSGLYFLNINNHGETIIKKIIKQ